MSDSATAVRSESDLPFVDVSSGEFRRDPLIEFRRVAGSGPVCRSTRGVEVLDHATAAELVNDPRLDSQDASVYGRMGGPPSLVEFASEGLLVAMRGDKHRRIRRVLSAGFRVRHVTDRRDSMRAVANELVDAFPGPECEFVRQFSSPFPMRVLCGLLGIPPQDIWMFTDAATELHLLAAVPLAPHFEAIDRALRGLVDYVSDLVAQRTRTPADDVISSLIAVQATEGALTADELSWNLVNLIFAGQDTTRYQLASAVWELAASGLWPLLSADPTLVPDAVDEASRSRPVTRFVVRIPSEPVVVHGVRVEAGRRIIVNLLAASHDPDRFEHPDEFRLNRPVRFELPFGWGMHHCLGAALARFEMEAALTVLCQRFDGVELTADPDVTAPAAMLHGPETLPLRFHTRSAL
jgi:cytochrome P450